MAYHEELLHLFRVLYPRLSFLFPTLYRQDDVKGRPFSILEGPNTDATALTTLKTEIQRGRAASSLVLNYKRDGSSFLNYLRVYPLIGDSLGTVTHFLGVSQVLNRYFVACCIAWVQKDILEWLIGIRMIRMAGMQVPI